MAGPTLGTVDGKPLHIDVPRLLETRALVTASSGWGKSWTLRRLIEQTHGHGAMQIVIDPEGEFSSLRERYDFVIAGKGGDCPAEPRSAGLLARRLLELGTSAVLDLYELRAKPDGSNHVAFVRHFLEGLINAPKELWRPVIVVVDEAHMFAPEKGEAQSRDAVRGLMTLGRKRGFGGVLATQRLAKLDKDACDAGNVLVGRFTLDVDVDRAGDSLGFTKARRPEIRRLERGAFFAFGPALSEDLVRVQVGAVSTTHPRAGQRAAAPPAPRNAVLKALEQLRDLPAEAETEARTAAELRKRVGELERELKAAKVGAPKAKTVEVPVLSAAGRAAYEKAVITLNAHIRCAEQFTGELRGALAGAEARIVEARALVAETTAALASPVSWPSSVTMRPVGAPAPRSTVTVTRPQAVSSHGAMMNPGPGEKLSGAERKVLTALAQYPDGRSKTQVAILTGYAHNGGGFNNAIGSLRSAGRLEGSGDCLRITDAGLTALGSYTPLPTGDALRTHWMGQLSKAERAALEALCGVYPDALDKPELAVRSGYEANGGGFNNALSRLRTLELISGRGELKASGELFDG